MLIQHRRSAQDCSGHREAKSGPMRRLCAYVPPSVLSDAVEFAIIR
jgi:hypothetical protein